MFIFHVEDFIQALKPLTGQYNIVTEPTIPLPSNERYSSKPSMAITDQEGEYVGVINVDSTLLHTSADVLSCEAQNKKKGRPKGILLVDSLSEPQNAEDATVILMSGRQPIDQIVMKCVKFLFDEWM